MLYLIRAQGTDFYKIGFTSGDITKRLKSLQTSSPHKLAVIILNKNGTRKDENFLHRLLSQYKTDSNNEWFKLSNELVDLITRQFSTNIENTLSWTSFFRGESEIMRLKEHCKQCNSE